MILTVRYIEDFMLDSSRKIFTNLWESMEWERREGAPRNECWMNDFGSPYTYGSGRGVRTYQAKEWNPLVKAIRMAVHVKTQQYYDACFVNGYMGQHDFIGWHSDDSPEINPFKPIAVVSFGAARPIQFRKIGKPGETSSLVLDPGSLMIMPAGFQQTHQHKLPKMGYVCDRRISLTFRCLTKY